MTHACHSLVFLAQFLAHAPKFNLKSVLLVCRKEDETTAVNHWEILVLKQEPRKRGKCRTALTQSKVCKNIHYIQQLVVFKIEYH